MIEAAMIWNEPNNKSHWDFENDPEWTIFARMAQLASQGVWPDLVVLVDVDPELARLRKRIGKAGQSELDAGSRKGLVGAGLAVRVRQAFLEMARKEPASAIAKALKRTEGATRQKATALGVSLNTTRGRAAAKTVARKAPARKAAPKKAAVKKAAPKKAAAKKSARKA